MLFLTLTLAALALFALLPTTSSLAVRASRTTRRAFSNALLSTPFLTALLPAAPSFAAPPASPPAPVDKNQEKSMLSSFTYPEPEPFVLRNQQLKFGKAAKPLKSIGELDVKKSKSDSL